MYPRTPDGSPRRPSNLLIAVLLVVFFAAGCTGSDEAWSSAVDSAESGADATVSTGDDDGAEGVDGDAEGVDALGFDGGAGEVSLAEDERIFRDPGATGEFASIAEEPALDLSPEALPAVVEPELSEPDAVLASVAEELGDGTDGGNEGAERLDRIPAIDEGPSVTGQLAERDGHRRNELGELLILDEPAALACAGVERALTALDEGERAAGESLMTEAAAEVEGSAVPGLPEWSGTLGDAVGTDDEVAALIGFLSVCTEGGYEL